MRNKTLLKAVLFSLFVGSSLALDAQQTNTSTTPQGTASAPAAAPEKQSLISNGDFSLATKDPSQPDGWALPKGATWEAENGIHFLRLTSPTPGATVLVYRNVALPDPLPPGIELRVRVRYTDVKVGTSSWFDARVMGNFKTAEGKGIKKGGEVPAPNFRGTSTEWVDKSVFVRVPPKARSVDIMPCLLQIASGTFDLAKVDVYPATEDQLPKPPSVIPSVTIVPTDLKAVPPELHVVGNQLQTADGKMVWLQGLAIASMEWSAGEGIMKSIPVATEQWKANVIRLPVNAGFWLYGAGSVKYRQLVDAAVEAANSRGAYLVLDNHRYLAPTDDDVAFWKDAAVRYKNHPGVIFELLNEPHSVSWKVWRDGGSLNSPENAHKDVNAKENNLSDDDDSEKTPGMQALVAVIRATGAKNLLIAGGLDWGYDLSGVANGFALTDPPGNDGIMYSSHIYPWKKNWQAMTLDAAAKYPVFLGEVGTPPDWKGWTFIPKDQQFEDLSKGEWPPDMIGLIQKYKLNWTAWCFHPTAAPCVISDWNYTPTPYWGAYVKEALNGKQFEMKKMR